MTPEQFELHAAIEDSHWWFIGRRFIIHNLVSSIILRTSSGRVLVDMGCGTGGNLSSFKKTFECTGIDISRDAILLAKRRFPEVNFICGGLEKQTYIAIEKADVVLLLDVLEHINNDVSFLEGLLGMLKKGSHLLITVPAHMALWSPHDDFHGHFRRYSRDELLSKFKDLNSEIRMLSYYNTALYPIIRSVRYFTRLTKRTWGKAHTDLSLPPQLINTFLTKIFAAECRWLVNLVDQPSRTLPFGVSIISLLRKN